MKSELKPLQQVSQLEGLGDIDFTNGFACDVETGICGPINETNEIDEKSRGEKE